MKKETHTSQEIQIEDGEVAYVRMPKSKQEKKIFKSMMLRDLMKEYKGYDIVLDFSEDNQLLGIEILAF